MRHSLRVLLGLGLALSAAGCSDYLSGPGISSTSDPNNIISLTKPGPLYVSIQQAGPPEREGQVARDAAQYMQQTAGVARQSKQFDTYITSTTDLDPYFGAVYGATNNLTGGGGLLDDHKMQQLARKLGDSLFIGIGKVYEAIIIGYAADIWGDIPYSQAADSTIPLPKFDNQMAVYAAVQAQLDSAINIFLTATGPTNAGPAPDKTELVYGGRGSDALRAVYTAVARSLKARYFLHVAAASVAGVPGAPPAPYDSAFKYSGGAAPGISSTADDFLWFADATPNANNIWWQFSSARAGDIAPGAALIEIMKRRMAAGVEDTLRIAFYFTSNDGAAASATGANFAGYRPTGATVATSGGIYNGSGPYSGLGNFINSSSGTDGSFRPPEITYAETQLIAAEAAWHLNGGGADPTVVIAAAQPFLNNARTGRQYGSSSTGPVAFGSAPGVLLASLQNIIEEKYVTLFLNPEVWNDWKRTCLPSLAPSIGAIPGRLPYGLTEINANPNVPATSSTGVTITSTSLNPNEPVACPVLNYTTSAPLAN